MRRYQISSEALNSSGTRRAVVVATLAAAIVQGLLAGLGFYIAGIVVVAPLHYAIFKGIWAGLMAAVLVVPMVLLALRNPKSTH